MIRSLWRWLTYKRVLIVFDRNIISQSSIASIQGHLWERQRVNSLAFGVDDIMHDVTFQIWNIESLKKKQFEQIRAEIDQYSKLLVGEGELAPTVIDPKELL